jgi:hypothetical protein
MRVCDLVLRIKWCQQCSVTSTILVAALAAATLASRSSEQIRYSGGWSVFSWGIKVGDFLHFFVPWQCLMRTKATANIGGSFKFDSLELDIGLVCFRHIPTSEMLLLLVHYSLHQILPLQEIYQAMRCLSHPLLATHTRQRHQMPPLVRIPPITLCSLQ